MLAAAASSHFYRLYRLMSEFKFPELLHAAQDSRSVGMRPLQPCWETAVRVNRLRCVEGPGR
jgi:hypothetical protein